jgi:hypothetical protein
MAASVAVSSDTRLGEVVDTSTTGFWAESDRLHVHPPLGALVSAPLPDGSDFYGIVSYGQTGGLDPTRRAIRRGGEELTDHAIYDRHPELEFVLRTLFRVTSAGYSTGNRIRHSLPPVPVPLHFSVHTCPPESVRQFVDSPGYFPALLRHQGEIAAEELIAAHILWTDKLLDDGHRWLASATRRLASLMKRDYDRLVVILSAIDPG